MLKIAYHPMYQHNLPDGHRFPMEKYDLLPQQLIYEGTCDKENFFEPEIPNNKYFFMVHDPDYVSDLMNITLNQKAARKIGFPLSEDLIAREMIIADGTIKASEFAIKYGIAMNIAGGTHHAFTNKGEGFCMLNDQAIGARYLQEKNFANKIWNAFRLIQSWEVDETLKTCATATAGIDWYSAKFQQTLATIDAHFSKYRISDALMSPYKPI